MEITDAASLLDCTELDRYKQPVTWADLGAGSGTFTQALAGLLPERSTVHALDKDPVALRSIPARYGGTNILSRPADFTRDALPRGLDGILLANALHYVPRQAAFLENLQPALKQEGLLLIVEYDIRQPNPWVPYPVDFATLRQLAATAGYPNIRKLGERPSLFGRGNIYAALIRKVVG